MQLSRGDQKLLAEIQVSCVSEQFQQLQQQEYLQYLEGDAVLQWPLKSLWLI